MNLLIAKAYAATDVITTTTTPGAPAMPGTPSMGETVGLNLLLVLILVVLFYVLLIMPQQKRFKRQQAMIDLMKKGDRVVTAGGLIGVIDKIETGNDEVIVDLGNNIKVTALRTTVQLRLEKKTPAK